MKRYECRALDFRTENDIFLFVVPFATKSVSLTNYETFTDATVCSIQNDQNDTMIASIEFLTTKGKKVDLRTSTAGESDVRELPQLLNCQSGQLYMAATN